MPLPQRHQDFQVLVLQVANFGFGSKVSLSTTSNLGLLLGVERTKPDESGPTAADLPLSGVLLSWSVASLIVSC